MKNHVQKKVSSNYLSFNGLRRKTLCFPVSWKLVSVLVDSGTQKSLATTKDIYDFNIFLDEEEQVKKLDRERRRLDYARTVLHAMKIICNFLDLLLNINRTEVN
ncbi:hypothetical protein M9H77_28918 [Catharanthus roseus]|uniref:Uncharacterized protein n=1 Tax=Catharanthus roseus TaxID=4058 RepID=A0ACC0AIN5_CATRO|nr:hypothetical protein M9H77_28918 [Catharanthus roseus]